MAKARQYLAAIDMVMTQPVDGPGAPATDLEIYHEILWIDETYDLGWWDEGDLAELHRILAKSPWRHDPDFRRWCRSIRETDKYGPERFWWYPEKQG
ncbi:MAG: hypothetical protein K6360_08090 [Deltaproteobacteria bacterium]